MFFISMTQDSLSYNYIAHLYNNNSPLYLDHYKSIHVHKKICCKIFLSKHATFITVESTTAKNLSQNYNP